MIGLTRVFYYGVNGSGWKLLKSDKRDVFFEETVKIIVVKENSILDISG